MYHFNIYTGTKQYFSGGKFAVEVFCIISGAFFFLKVSKSGKTISTFEYAKSRFCRFFPYTTTAFLLMFFYLSNGKSISEIVELFSKYIWEIFLVGMTGLNRGGALLNSPTWTISCLLIVECSIYGLLICYNKQFFNFILPVSLLVIYGIWANAEEVNYRTWMGFLNFGVLQVWCAVVVGILSVLTSARIAKIKRISKLLTAVELSSYLAIYIIMLNRSNFYWGLVLTLLSFIAVSITLSQKSYSGVMFRSSTFTNLLGRLSFSIYINHSLLLKIFVNTLGPKKMFCMWPLFLIVLILFSFTFDIAISHIVKMAKQLNQKIKHYYFNDNI